ncbi:MAG: DUF4160 domain-containing protein [Devosia sp.]
MITVLSSRGLRFVIYLADHDPPHVHVYGDGFAKILLVGGNGKPAILDDGGMKGGDLRKALLIVQEHQAEFLARWRQMHG